MSASRLPAAWWLDTRARGLRRRQALGTLLAGALLATAAQPGSAARERPGRGGSEPGARMGEVAVVPLAQSVAAPAGLFAGGATLRLVAVGAVADGAVWVLERASDGQRASVRVAEATAPGAPVPMATTVTVAALSTGWILSAGGRALCFIPNVVGRALLHQERVTL